MQDSGVYSTKRINPQLVAEICRHLTDLDYGSIELSVVDYNVTQITRRQITKTGKRVDVTVADRTRRHRSF